MSTDIEKLLHWMEQEAGYARNRTHHEVADALHGIVANTRAAIEDERHDGKIIPVTIYESDAVPDDFEGRIETTTDGREWAVGKRIGAETHQQWGHPEQGIIPCNCPRGASHRWGEKNDALEKLRNLDNRQLYADEIHRAANKPGLILESVSDLQPGDVVTAIKGQSVIQSIWNASLTLDGHTFDLELMQHTGWTLSYKRDW